MTLSENKDGFMDKKEKEKVDVDQLKLNSIKEIERKEISDNFIEKYKYLVETIANKISKSQKLPPCIEYADLVSWGVEGLIKGKSKFQASANAKFETYAWYRIRGEILDSIRNEWKYRMPKDYANIKKNRREALSDFIIDHLSEADKTETSENIEESIVENTAMASFLTNDITDLVADKKGMKNPEVELIDESYDEIRKIISSLEEDEKQLIDLFYVQGLKQVEIAQYLKYSKSKVCRLHMGILKKIKVRLNKEETNETIY